MLNRETIIKRLALIKYLYKMGIDQSKQSDPIASFSILTLHDSIEMFLKLLAEHKNIKKETSSFLEYWEIIPTLTLKESMRNLNNIRVNIKHKGLLASKTDVEICRVYATDFFEQNTFVHFQEVFKDISLFSLIQNQNIRQYLETAQNALNERGIKRCIETVAIAFETLLTSYENTKRSRIDKTPFSFGKSISHFHSFNMKGPRNGQSPPLRLESEIGSNMCEFVDKVRDCLEEMKKALKIISLGIDYKKYVKLRLLIPEVSFLKDGTASFIWVCEEEYWSESNCQYCIDFVLDCALKLQEFDFELNELVEKPVKLY